MNIVPTEIVTDVSKPFTGTLSDGWQWLLGDRIAAWRLINAAKIQLKINEELAAMGMATVPDRIPERYAFAWFEEATKQDEDDIQTLFARLLAKAAVGDEDALDRRLLEIVSRMVPGDAAVLNYIFPAVRDGEGKTIDYFREFSEYELVEQLEKDLGDDPRRSFEHLLTLGVFERETYLADREIEDFVKALTLEIRGDPSWFNRIELQTKQVVKLTSSGYALVRAIAPVTAKKSQKG